MDFNRLAIIIPSYNESTNLAILLADIGNLYPYARVCIVDDSLGQEKTEMEKIVSSYPKKTHTLIQRSKKKGRGSAVMAGIRQVLKDKGVKILIEMDADLAHDPKEIVLLLSKIPPCDMVIGSRYLNKSVIINWPKKRLLQSRLINFFLRYFLGIAITDYTNGFRAYSRRAAEYLVSIPIYERGFITLSEIAYRLYRKGFRIGEVPTTFTDRKYGTSNAGVRELIISLIGVARIRFRRPI
jgi:glycosyltransferase involved in cell wall biosynthesis